MKRFAFAIVVAGCSSAKTPATVDAPSTPDSLAASPDATTFPTTLEGNRDRLLHTYYAWLETEPTIAQSNGLVGQDLTSVCDLWSKLDLSSQDVFRTITHRLQGSVLHTDGTHMLDHVVKLYRVIGGEGASGTANAGSCGGGEYNRMIMSMDTELHDIQVTANTDQGATPYDIADIPSTSFWRDSHDLGGPHAPFDLSDETNLGAPRGQTQYFRDPTSAAATSALGRMDLMTLVDPYALEMDQDYDCAHNSNPTCDYTLYGTACFPETSLAGVDIYTATYGDFGATWQPSGC